MSSNDEQNTEIEVLKSIYWEDFKELEPVEGWPSFEVHLKSQNEYSKPDEYHLKDLGITLKVTYNADYPQTSAPSFEIQELKELETEDDCKQTALTIEKENLMKILIEQCQEMIGEVVIFALITSITQFFEETTEDILAKVRFDKQQAQYEEELLKRETEHKPKVFDAMSGQTTELLRDVEKPMLKEPKKKPPPSVDAYFVPKQDDKPSLLNLKRYLTTVGTQKVASVQPYLAFNFYKRRPATYNRQLRRVLFSTSLIPGKNSVFVYGGSYNGNFTNDLFTVSTPQSSRTIKSHIHATVERVSQLAPFPPTRAFQGMAQFQRTFVIVGGVEVNSKRFLDDVWYFQQNKAGGYWSALSKCPRPIAGMQLVSDGYNMIYGFGGMFEDGSYNQNVWELRIWGKGGEENSSAWYVVPHQGSATPGRIGHSMLIEGSNIYMFGGHTNETIYSSLSLYDTGKRYWTSITTLGPGPTLTYASKIMRSNTDGILIYGGFDKKRWSDSVYEYSISQRSWRLHCGDVEGHAALTGCEMVGSDILILGGMSSDGAPSPLQTFLQIIQRLVNNDKINGVWSKKSENSDIIGARVMQYQTFNDMGETKNTETVSSLRSWFRAQNPELSDLQIIFYSEHNDHEQKIIYSNMFVLQQCEVLANCRRKEVETVRGKSWVINAYEDKLLSKMNPRILQKVIEFMYTNEVVVSDKEEEELNEEDIEEMFQISLTLRIPLLKDLLLGSVNFQHLLLYNYSRTMFEATERLLTPLPFDENSAENKQWIKTRPQGLVRIVSPETNNYIHAHKGLLIYRSPYFFSMFATAFAESQTNEIFIDELSIDGIRAILIYMYTGIIPVITPEVCLEIYLATHQFHLTELQPWLRILIRENIDVDTACSVLDIAEMIGDTNMKRFCIHFIAKNYKVIVREDNVFYKALPELVKDEIFVNSKESSK